MEEPVAESPPLRIESSALAIDASERRRRRALAGAAASAVGLLGVCVALSAGSSPAICGLVYIFSMATLLFLAAALRARSRPETFAGAVYIEGRSLVVRPGPPAVAGTTLELRSFPLADVLQGFWESPDRVHLVLRGGESVIARASRGGGDWLLDAAGVSPAQRVLKVPLASVAARVPSASPLFGAALGPVLLVAVVLLAKFVERVSKVLGGSSEPGILVVGLLLGGFVVVSAGLVVVLRKRLAVVGTDGVRFHGAVLRRFVPYAVLEGAEAHPRGVRLLRRDARPLLLPTGRVTSAESELYRDVLLERVREGIAGGRGEPLPQVVLEKLERRGRPIPAWREELGKLLSEAGDYRRRGLSAADLGAVIEDPTAPAERRIGAAVALGAARRDEARRRVRVATQASVDEELRRALERAAEGEIEAALVEREEKRRTRT